MSLTVNFTPIGGLNAPDLAFHDDYIPGTVPLELTITFDATVTTGNVLRVQTTDVADDATFNEGDLTNDITHYLVDLDFDEEGPGIDLTEDGFEQPSIGPWSMRAWVERDDDITSDYDYLYGEIESVIPLTFLAIDGDSISVPAYGLSEQWAIANSVDYTNSASGGATISILASRVSTVMADDPSHIFVKIGANDLLSLYDDAQDFMDNLLALFTAYKALKPSVKIIASAPYLIDEEGTANSPPAKYGHNDRCREVWGLMRAEVGNGLIDAYCPDGEHPYYSEDRMVEGGPVSTDGLHINQSGAYDASNAVIAAVLDSILAEDEGVIPAAFSFTDEGNAVASDPYADYIIVAGMGMGQSATATESGDGTFARGQATPGTTSFDVMNGDYVSVQLTADPTPEVVVNETVTIGGVSDTFTLTTEGGSSLTTTYRTGAVHNDGFGAPSSFTGITTHTGLKHVVVLVSSNGGLPSALSLDGNAMTRVAYDTASANTVSVWEVVIATGGSSKSLVTTNAGGAYALGFGMWTTDASADFVSAVAAFPGATDPQTTGSSLTMQPGGSIFGGAIIGAGYTTLTANTGCTELGEYADGTSGKAAWFGSRATSGALGLNGANYAGTHIIAVSYQP